jgi:hypothetical protein
MIDIRKEDPISFTDAAGTLPARRGGKRPHVATLHRWATIGCRGVKLEFVCIGAQRCTSNDALQRFFDRLTELDQATATNTPAAPKASRSKGKRKKAVEAARRRLARA